MERFWLFTLNHKANPLVWPVLLILAIGSVLYRIGLALNSFSKTGIIKTEAKVVSVGNITVGGSGKTPITVEIAKFCTSKGYKTAIASGGYKRRDKRVLHGTGSEISRMPIDQTGDEPMLMANNLPDVYFAIAGSKSEAAKLLDEKYHPDVILIDDGFQHRKLHRDLDILLIDATSDLTREYLLPLGRLREPLNAARRADLIIQTKSNLSDNAETLLESLKTKFPDTPILQADFLNRQIISNEESLEIGSVQNRSVYFFAGVAGFKALFEKINALFPNILGHRAFSDHCPYDSPERTLISEEIERLNPEILLTTEKDYVKIRNFDFGRTIYYLDLQLEFDPDGKNELFDRLESLVNR